MREEKNSLICTRIFLHQYFLMAPILDIKRPTEGYGINAYNFSISLFFVNLWGGHFLQTIC